jgi:hypothetical protein
MTTGICKAQQNESKSVIPVDAPGVVEWELTVIGGVFLAGDHRLGMEERPVRADLHIFDNARFEVHVDRTGDVLSGSGLRKEGGETVLSRFCGAFLNAAVRLSVSGLAAIMRETRDDTHT